MSVKVRVARRGKRSCGGGTSSAGNDGALQRPKQQPKRRSKQQPKQRIGGCLHERESRRRQSVRAHGVCEDRVVGVVREECEPSHVACGRSSTVRRRA